VGSAGTKIVAGIALRGLPDMSMAEASPYADAIALLDAELTYAEVRTFLYHHSGGPSPSTPPVLD
jgi:hypothetical protein